MNSQSRYLGPQSAHPLGTYIQAHPLIGKANEALEDDWQLFPAAWDALEHTVSPFGLLVRRIRLRYSDQIRGTEPSQQHLLWTHATFSSRRQAG